MALFITDPNTEGTPTIIEAALFSRAVIIVQVNKIVEQFRRLDIPAQWVEFIIESPKTSQ
jgi:malonate decarboxylase alpha subunit